MGFFAGDRILPKGRRFLVLAGAAAFLAALAVIFPVHRDLAGAALKVAANAPHPLIGKYCMSCHDSEEHVANLAFDKLSLQRVSANPEVWEKVARKLNAGLMPPSGNPRPPADEIHEFPEGPDRPARCGRTGARAHDAAQAQSNRIRQCHSRPARIADRSHDAAAAGCGQRRL